MLLCVGLRSNIVITAACPTKEGDTCGSAADYVGWALFGLGFAVQVVADVQKYLFRADQANRRRVCDRGLWRFSRHPNFCGEVLLWIGVYVAGAPVFRAAPAGWWTVASPLFTLAVLTLFTGIPQAEGQNAVRWYDGGEAQAQYEVYFERTPPLWLLPPQLYRLLPRRAKLLLCCELCELRCAEQEVAELT